MFEDEFLQPVKFAFCSHEILRRLPHTSYLHLAARDWPLFVQNLKAVTATNVALFRLSVYEPLASPFFHGTLSSGPHSSANIPFPRAQLFICHGLHLGLKTPQHPSKSAR